MRAIINTIALLPFLLILSTVFIISKDLAYGVVSGKYFWFYGCMGLIAVSAFVYVIISRKNIRFTTTDLFILLFALAGAGITYFRNEVITTKLILFVLICLLYFYFRAVLSGNKQNASLLLLFFILTGGIEAVWGLRQLYGYLPSQHNLFRTTGSFFNPGPYAGYLAMTLPAAFYYVLADYHVIGKKITKTTGFSYVRWIISTATVIAVLLILPATMSRASWLGALAGCFVAGGFFLSGKYDFPFYFRKHKKRIIAISSVFVVLVLTGLSGMYHVKKDSADGRALIWKTTLSAIPNQPLGVGLGNFAGAYGLEQAGYFASGKGSEQEKNVAGSPEYAFNELLQIGLELGIIGFALFITIIVSSLYQDYKRRQFPAIASITALLVFACMSYPFSVLPFPIALAFLLAVCNTTFDENRQQKFNYTNRNVSLAGLLFSGIIVFFCLFNRMPTYEAYKKWNTVKLLFDMKQYERIEKDYAELYPYLNDQINFLFEYGQTLSNTGKYEASNRILTQATKISGDPMLYNIIGKNHQSLNNQYLAEQNFIQASFIVPHRIYPYYLLMKLYIESGNETKAKAVAEKILIMPPKIDSPAIREMKEEASKLKDKR